MQFQVDRARSGGTGVLTVRGELDISTAPALGQEFDDVVEPDVRRVVLDLTATEFIDSTACRLISQSARRLDAAGASFVIVCPDDNHNVFRVLEFVGLTQVFDVVPAPPALPDDAGGHAGGDAGGDGHGGRAGGA